jgi:hypothetical protein
MIKSFSQVEDDADRVMDATKATATITATETDSRGRRPEAR